MADNCLQPRSFADYLNLWLSLARNCFLRQSEYKIDFVGRLSIECVWILTQIIFYKAALSLVPQLGNWQEGEIWFFVASLVIADALMMMFVHDNLNKFGQIIRLGMLDFYLLYPLSTRFLAMLRFVNLVSIVNIVCGGALMFFAVSKFDLHLNMFSWIVWLAYLPLGVVMIGVLASAIATVAFWTTQSTNLIWFFYELYRLGHRPESLYSTWMRRLLLTVFPAAFFISIPVQLALGKLQSFWWYLAPLAVLTILWVIAQALWDRGIRMYEGAMS